MFQISGLECVRVLELIHAQSGLGCPHAPCPVPRVLCPVPGSDETLNPKPWAVNPWSGRRQAAAGGGALHGSSTSEAEGDALRAVVWW